MVNWLRLLLPMIVACSIFGGVATAAPPAAAPPVNTPIYDKWALIIGISKFKDPSINLKYPAKDARDLYNFLLKQGNFAPDHVKLLLNEEATRENILSALGDKWLPRVANPNDLVVIYISSHGSPAGMDVRGVNYIVAYDTDRDSLFSTGLPMQDLVRIIKGRVHADRIVLMLDACHSGAATPEGKGVFQQGNVNVDEIVAGTGQLVISSSQPDQVSWESKTTPNGVFTQYLIEGLKQKGDRTTLGEAFAYMRDQVQTEVLRDRGVLQTPVLKSKWEGRELALLAPPYKPRPGLKEQTIEWKAQPRPGARPLTPAAPVPSEPTPAPSSPNPVNGAQATLWNTYMQAVRQEIDRRNFGEARRILGEAQRESENFPAGDPRRTSTQLEVANLAFLQKDYIEAEPLYWTVLADMERTPKPDLSQRVLVLASLAQISQIQGKTEEAGQLAKQALSLQDKADIPARVKAAALDVLAASSLSAGRMGQAEEYARQALALRQGMPSPDERELVKNLCLLNKALIAEDKAADAEANAQRAIALSTKSFGPNTTETADCLEIYSHVMSKLQRLSEARQYATRAKAVRRKLGTTGGHR